MGNFLSGSSRDEPLLQVYASCLDHLETLSVACRAIVEGLTSQQCIVDGLTPMLQTPGVPQAKMFGLLGVQDLCQILTANQKCSLLQACNITKTVDKIDEVLNRNVHSFLTDDQIKRVNQQRRNYLASLSQASEYGRCSDEKMSLISNDCEFQVKNLVRMISKISEFHEREKQRQFNQMGLLEQNQSLLCDIRSLGVKINTVEKMMEVQRNSGGNIGLREIEQEMRRQNLSFYYMREENRQIMHKVGQQIQCMQKEIDSLQGECKHIGEQLNQMEAMVNKLRKPARASSNVVQTAKDIPRSSSSYTSHPPVTPRTIPVQVYAPQQGSISVLEEFVTLLKSSIGDHQEVIPCHRVDQIKKEIPVIVICINASRIGLDVQNATTGIEKNSNMALIVLHHKAKHALPNQSIDRVLTSPEYKQLGGLFDMAFLAGQGFYPCDMNDSALNNLSGFLSSKGMGN